MNTFEIVMLHVASFVVSAVVSFVAVMLMFKSARGNNEHR